VYLTEKLLHKRINKQDNGIEEYKIRDNYHTVLLAKNYEGVKEINKLIGLSTQKDHVYYKPRITFEEFFNISDNVIKISACLASPLARLRNRCSELESEIKELQSKFEEIQFSSIEKIFLYEEILRIKMDDLEYLNESYDKLLQHYDYYEIQYHNVSDQIEYNQDLYRLSQKYNKPLIAGTDTHSLNKYKAECRIILQKAKTGSIFGTKKSDTTADFTSMESEFDLTYKSYDELVEMFKIQNSLPMDVVLEAINNTNVMADSVEDFELDPSIKYPHMYDNDEEVFLEKVDKMYNEKLQNGIIPMDEKEDFDRNLAEEIRVFKKLDMCGFMLSMGEICGWAKQNNHPLGFSRGSCGGSCVAYVLDITDLNPVKWKTVFSRFCNEDRKEIGD
jgi:DNA polymerase-3 subunit alpha